MTYIPGGSEPRQEPLGPTPPTQHFYPPTPEFGTFPASSPYLPPRRKKRRTGLIVGLIAAVLVVLAAGGVTAYVLTRGPDLKQQATQACEDKLRASLKAPATAQFSGIDASPSDATQAADGRGWYVTGNVDAQNSFGALIRSTWTCYAYQRGDKSWDARPNVSQ